MNIQSLNQVPEQYQQSSSINQTQPDKLKIDLSSIVKGFSSSTPPPQDFNASDIDLMTRCTFKELIQEKFDSHQPYFLAMIKQSTDNSRHYHPYDAANLIEWIKPTPLNQTPRNPQTKAPLKTVFYFSIKPGEEIFRLFLIAKANRANDQATFMQHLLVAQKGDMEAQFTVAIMYADGKGIKKSLEEAFLFFKMAADQGHQAAQYEVNLCYKYGSGTMVSPIEALKYLQKTIKHKRKHPKALYHLANYYANETDPYYATGFEKKPDPKEAFRLMQSVARGGLAKAQYALGLYYEQGVGVKRSLPKAREYIAAAANQGHLPAQSDLQRLVNQPSHGATTRKSKRDKLAKDLFSNTN